MHGLIQDVRYAGRQLLKSPGFAGLTILTIAIGIGAATAMFSLVDRILFRSLPYPHDEQLVSVGVVAPIIDGEFLFASNYLDWRDRQTAFTNFTSSTGINDCDLTDGQPVRVACAAVASTFLPTFSIQPLLGRNFTRDEDHPKSSRVALLTYHLWQDRFAGDRNVLGRVMSVDGQPTEIIGVLPRDFEYPTLAHTDLVVPQALDESIVQRNVMGAVVRVFGRMKPGATEEQAKAELQPLFRDFVQSAPPPFRQVLRLQVHSIHDLQVHDSRRAAWLLLLSAVALLAIACTNAANLVLARSTGRRLELAVRSALGAGRARLFRQRLTESVMLALIGGAFGTGIAYLLLRVSVSLAPAGIPRLTETSIDIRILFFALAVSLISGIFFGTAPALERPPQMLSVNAVAGHRPSRLRQGLLVVEVWIAIILMTSAFLFVRSLRKLQAEPLGINTQHIVTAEFTLGQQKYSTAKERLAFFEAVERRLAELPGIDAAALTDSLPPSTPARTMPYFALQGEGQPPLPPTEGVGGIVGWRCVTPDYFLALGIALRRGRPFNEQDRAPDVHTIILNQALARKIFSTDDVLGRKIQFRTDRAALSSPFTIVGVTGNAQNQGLGGTTGPEYYMVRHHSDNDIIFNYPDSQRVSIIIRSAIAGPTLAHELRETVASLDPTLPVELSTLARNVSRMAERPRFSAALLSLFALIGLLLTAFGIYGVVSLLVNQRTQEIGIRMALGATQSQVVGIVVWQASVWIGVGAVAGILGSLVIARWIGSMLFGVRANDPVTLAAAAGALVLVAVIAAWIPARRTAKVDPMVALRYE
jgi:putative ABC transport system permease protein